MIIEVEYPITTTGIPARSNKKKQVVFKDTVRIDIPEYAPSEAPVILLVPGPDGFQPTEYYGIGGKIFCDTVNRVPKSGRCEFILGARPTGDILVSHLEAGMFDLGRHLRNRNSTAIAAELYPPVLADHFVSIFNSGMAFTEKLGCEARLPSFDEITVSEMDTAEVERQKEAFLAHLSEFAIVDGRFMRTVPEPLYSVTVGYPSHPDTEGTSPAIRILKPGRDGQVHAQGSVNVVAYFSADRLEDSRSYALEMKAAQSDKPFEVEMPREIEVFDRSYLTFDTERESLLVMAEHMVADAMRQIFKRSADNISMRRVREGLDRVSPDAILAWKSLSQAMRGPNPEELACAMRECLDIYDHEGERMFVEYPYTAEMYETSLEKWNNREVRLEFGARTACSRGLS